MCDACVMTWQGGSRRLLAPRGLLRDTGAAQAPSAPALSGLLGNSMGAAPGSQMYMVVGFEVMACSIARVAGQKPSDVSCIDTLEGKPPAPQEVTKGMARDGDASWPAPDPSLPCPCIRTQCGAQAKLYVLFLSITADQAGPAGHDCVNVYLEHDARCAAISYYSVIAGSLLLFGQRL